jgi:hypothetical protein
MSRFLLVGRRVKFRAHLFMDVRITRMPEAAADLVFWIALACCAVAQIAIIRSVLVATPATSPASTMPKSSRFAEIAWAVLPAVMLGLVFWATWRAMHTHVLGAHHASSVLS